ncbi:MAG: hypothetical protein UY76_C0009G0011 [Candidatus Uhrbacteria bacterium GW2011_GWA2_52_8d]|uniref:Uncharacterized protein n=1 Tax=Candidatus Uhrbacteria bacterium GW2011_GWA2_52_8d TaxID=1618979 RepID=A0A0G1XQI0_9BACT|nr:MAG: hypothetical protein UY76_C0009G0011 [Candidatus Uhrbacteria bacterium GW2011_GWA2_52_8d]
MGGFILSVFVIAFMLYALFFRSAPPAPTVEEVPEIPDLVGLPGSTEAQPRESGAQQGGTAGLEPADDVARGGLTQTTELTTGAVFNSILNGDGQTMNYYNATDGRFYTIDEDGTVVALSSAQFPQAQDVQWNKDSNKALIEFPDGSNIVYNFDTQRQTTLPAHWEDFDFSPVTDEILAKNIALDPQNRWLIITNEDGSKTQSIQALGENEEKVNVNWSPNDQVVAFASTAQAIQGGLDRNVIYPVGKNQENFKGLVVEGLGFDSVWSPNGKQLLYSVSGSYSNDKPLLWIVDASASTMGDNRRSLGLNTWVDKCTWSSSTTVYCAVPLNLPSNAGLARAVYQDKPDVLYKLDLLTETSTLIAVPAEETAMNNLQVSTDGSMIYFTNTSGQLELMRLK